MLPYIDNMSSELWKTI